MHARKGFGFVMTFLIALLVLAQGVLATSDAPSTTIYLGQDPMVHNPDSYIYTIYATLYNIDLNDDVTSCQINWGAGWESVDKGTEAEWYSVPHTYSTAGKKTVDYRCTSAGGTSYPVSRDTIQIVQDTTAPVIGMYLGSAPGIHNNNVYSQTLYANLWNKDPNSPVSCQIDWGNGWQAESAGTPGSWYNSAHTYAALGTKTVNYRCTSDGGTSIGAVKHINWDSAELISEDEAPASLFDKIFHLPKQFMKITRLFFAEETVRPGNELRLLSKLDINKDLDNVKITATVAELGLRKRMGPFDLDKDDSKNIYITIPEGTPEGEYTLRVTINNADFRRVKHRTFVVTN